MRRFMDRYDLLLTPTMPCPPFQAGLDQPEQSGRPSLSSLGWTPFTYPFNLTGQPAATVPAGFTSAGLPVGLQIVGRFHDDTTVLQASKAFESIRPWAQVWPNDEPFL
jgi:aspartyl-tRNA(Asn)/glutamyl-tRNA(Gln) amidotransferase subunit A